MPHSPRRTLCLLGLALVPLGAALAGCSDPEGAASPATTASTPAPLPLTDRVVRGAELAGFTPAPASALDLAAIAEENDVTIAELRRRGVVRAAKTELSGPPDAFAISAVAELGSPGQARAEAARLFAANGSSEEGLAATAIDVPGIPGAAAARKTGSRGGKDYVAIDVTWSDGALAHELFVLGLVADVRQADVLAAAAAVAARSTGAPLGPG